MHNDRCYRGGGLHKFRPRYSEKSHPGKIKIEYTNVDPRALLYYSVYVCDVCEWCGKIAGKECENIEELKIDPEDMDYLSKGAEL